MKPNEGSIDRIIRFVLGGGLIAAAIFWLGAMTKYAERVLDEAKATV